MKLFYNLFGILMCLIIIAAITGYLPIVKFVISDTHPQDKLKLPYNTAYFIDKNIIDLEHIP